MATGQMSAHPQTQTGWVGAPVQQQTRQSLQWRVMVKFVLCSQVIEIKVKGFTYRDAFQRQELLRQSMLHIMCIGIDRQDKQIKAKGGKCDDND